jgi:hypothetical protein
MAPRKNKTGRKSKLKSPSPNWLWQWIWNVAEGVHSFEQRKKLGNEIPDNLNSLITQFDALALKYTFNLPFETWQSASRFLELESFVGSIFADFKKEKVTQKDARMSISLILNTLDFHTDVIPEILEKLTPTKAKVEASTRGPKDSVREILQNIVGIGDARTAKKILKDRNFENWGMGKRDDQPLLRRLLKTRGYPDFIIERALYVLNTRLRILAERGQRLGVMVDSLWAA